MAKQIDEHYEIKHKVHLIYSSRIVAELKIFMNKLHQKITHVLINRHYMTDAVKAYEEKPRDQWLFDYPAQVSLCGTQIWWTSEVIALFLR